MPKTIPHKPITIDTIDFGDGLEYLSADVQNFAAQLDWYTKSQCLTHDSADGALTFDEAKNLGGVGNYAKFQDRVAARYQDRVEFDFAKGEVRLNVAASEDPGAVASEDESAPTLAALMMQSGLEHFYSLNSDEKKDEVATDLTRILTELGQDHPELVDPMVFFDMADFVKNAEDPELAQEAIAETILPLLYDADETLLDEEGTAEALDAAEETTGYVPDWKSVWGMQYAWTSYSGKEGAQDWYNSRLALDE